MTVGDTRWFVPLFIVRGWYCLSEFWVDFCKSVCFDVKRLSA